MRTIALLDPFTGGHHDWYLELIATAMTAKSWSVVLVSPSAESIVGRMHGETGVAARVWRPSVVTGASGRGRLWRDANEAVTQAEREFGSSIDFVFFAWLDSFLGRRMLRSSVDRWFPRQWSGLVFQPIMFRVPVRVRWARRLWLDPFEVLRSRNCRVVAALDENIAGVFGDLVQKPVVHFPDVASTGRISGGLPLAREMRVRAAGRLVVLMTGVIDGRKGLGRFIKAARAADGGEWFFVIAGRVARETLGVDEAGELERWRTMPPANGWMATEHPFPEDSAINECITSSDVVWLSYENFPFSSNLLSKCAAFQVPAISNGEYLIGERVLQHSLGVMVPRGEEETHFADTGFAERIKALKADSRFKRGCVEYSAVHSRDALSRAISEVIAFLS